jgi:hypothetical protein
MFQSNCIGYYIISRKSHSVKLEIKAASGRVTSKAVSVALTSSLIIVLVILVEENRYRILDLICKDTTFVVCK